jgi:hypothetical protein
MYASFSKAKNQEFECLEENKNNTADLFYISDFLVFLGLQ